MGNYDIDFFIFRPHPHITTLKFPKLERDQNAAEKFQIDINESTKLQKSTKVDKIIF